ESDDRPRLRNVAVERSNVETLRIPQGSIDISETDHEASVLGEEAGRHTADIPETLHDDAAAVELITEALGGVMEDVHDAAPSRFPTPERTADEQWLAGHDAGNRPALHHRVRVHHPRHHLLISAEVGRRDVEIWTDERHDLRRIPSRQMLSLPR